jgi:hypothetical protein
MNEVLVLGNRLTAGKQSLDVLRDSYARQDCPREKARTREDSQPSALRALGRHLVRVNWSLLTHRRDYQSANPCSKNLGGMFCPLLFLST